MSSRPSGGLPRKILLLALAYFAAASLARLLAIPPGYAAVVWPSAGVAVAALWLWGVALWPGVLLGSFAANVWNPVGGSSNAPLAAWIAVGAAAQAAAAVLAARRVLSGRDPLRGDGDRIRFLLIAGPVAGLIAATWAVIGMRVLGAISAPETAFAWATWWVGDAIGVALAAPLVLLWFGPRRGPRRGRAIVSAALALTMAAVAAVHLYAVRNEEDILRSHTRRKVADVSLTLRVGLAGHLDSLQTAADIFASGKNPTRAEFKNFAGGILARHPGMQALEWRPRVSAIQRGAVEAAARREGLKGFSFTGIGPNGALVRRGPAAVYFPIYYVEPLAGNEKALGLDIGQQQNPVHDAAERALTTGQASASGGVRLIQETGEQRGVVVMVPVSSMRDGGPIGLIEGVYRVGDMMESLLAGVDRRTLGMRLYDDTSPNAPELLYSRGAPPEGSSPPITMTGDFAGRRWRVELIPLRGFQSRDRSVLSWFVVAASFLFSYLVCWTTLTLFGRAETIAALVEQKTEELREQERRLMQAQKLESVGLLAGGIAHEFNNILMGASGLAQIVRASVGPAHPSAPDLDEIVATIKRASHLVTQLLTYSRRKDPQ
ncbi:MAG: CHASE domain-containing protein, partial [Elusimicrobia bacterium]|nr:CHASE domain-containing protein [Elusimicrobiota bacterium]